ncbi:MAG: FKBP-type peptidyl-prolyl cis-trans isomerase N-terminal domain-containing protein, partial [Prosthecobacter sp.]
MAESKWVQRSPTFDYPPPYSRLMPSPALEIGKSFLADNATKPGVITTASGLQYLVLTPGTGTSPKKTDTVVVN